MTLLNPFSEKALHVSDTLKRDLSHSPLKKGDYDKNDTIISYGKLS